MTGAITRNEFKNIYYYTNVYNTLYIQQKNYIHLVNNERWEIYTEENIIINIYFDK